MGREIQICPTTDTQPLLSNEDIPEHHLRSRDGVLARIIDEQTARWNPQPTENVLWGLVRIVISQQISTVAAGMITGRIQRAFPNAKVGRLEDFSYDALRLCGVSPRKANCCLSIAEVSDRISEELTARPARYDSVQRISGVGRWTVDIHRIMILKEPDVMPYNDHGLRQAILRNYSDHLDMAVLSASWQPFRSVACWYLWRSLGNPPLG